MAFEQLARLNRLFAATEGFVWVQRRKKVEIS